ncbi:iron-sulfur cluster binding protein [Candidatus Vecturithrix granuli]|uniref:Iron-sulfur cluster binding protein n=1 Tax=Vecturithrix granuli TaxID=1499967 RepID=A0A081C4H6_VECG1|nr:iron-sulfur cluster binding protein [Candidatus Vecturithrix granuli]
MKDNRDSQNQQLGKTADLKFFVRSLGVDVVGIADLKLLGGMSIGIIASDSADFLRRYQWAIVLGAQLGKLGKNVSGTEVNVFLEKAALEIMAYLEEQGYCGLIVHTEDEFDPINRLGLLSLKMLAKGAGLGWQGRSLLIISPEYGPIHRWIAVLTNMDLQADEPIPNQCGDCSFCVDTCPYNALRFVSFDDHPEHREDVLDIRACRGDDGCTVCLLVCPWAKSNRSGAGYVPFG